MIKISIRCIERELKTKKFKYKYEKNESLKPFID